MGGDGGKSGENSSGNTRISAIKVNVVFRFGWKGVSLGEEATAVNSGQAVGEANDLCVLLEVGSGALV